MKPKTITLLILSLFIFSGLACTISGVTEQVINTKETAQSVITQAQAFATQAAPMIQTVQAISTNSPNLLETGQAFITESAPIVSTLQGVATQNPGVASTLEAAIIQGIGALAAPVDIPVLEQSQITNFIAGEHLVTYSTMLGYPDVLTFYQTQMVINGWAADISSTYQLPNAAVLAYQKADRSAIVNLVFNSSNNTTTVVITIQGQ